MAIRFESQNVASARAMISTLESGECQTLSGFTWEEYERLLEELGDGYAVRVAYAEGTLEVIRPLYLHEKYKETLLLLVRLLTSEARAQARIGRFDYSQEN